MITWSICLPHSPKRVRQCWSRISSSTISACSSATALPGLIASHIPFLVEHHGEELHLLCHLARPNPQVEDLSHGEEVLTIFSGPHAYVSPSWYAAGPAVPTWNYVDVHAYGTVRLVEDGDWLRRLLLRLSDRHEAGSPAPWRMQDLPEPYLQGMLKGIIGFDIAVTRLEGKYKLSQNRPAVDRPRVIAALERREDADSARRRPTDA